MQKPPYMHSTLKPLLVNTNFPNSPIFSWLKMKLGPTTESLSSQILNCWCVICPSQICPDQCQGIIDFPIFNFLMLRRSQFLIVVFLRLRNLGCLCSHGPDIIKFFKFARSHFSNRYVGKSFLMLWPLGFVWL